jgi:hypothetical protein
MTINDVSIANKRMTNTTMVSKFLAALRRFEDIVATDRFGLASQSFFAHVEVRRTSSEVDERNADNIFQ